MFICFHHRDNKRTSSKNALAKIHGKSQNAPHSQNVRYGESEDVGIDECTFDTYLSKRKGLSLRTSHRAPVNGKPTKKLKRKVRIELRGLLPLSMGYCGAFVHFIGIKYCSIGRKLVCVDVTQIRVYRCYCM